MSPRYIPVLCLVAAANAAAQNAPPQFARAEPFVERARQRGPVVELTLKAALEQALERNLQITIQKFTLSSNRVRLTGAKGYYDPLLSFSAGLNSSDSPTTSILQGSRSLTSENSRSASFGPSFRQYLPQGGSLNVSLSSFRNTSSNSYTFVNPVFGSGFSATVTQPLLRGFHWNAANRQIRVLRLESRVGQAQFRQVLAETVQRVRNAYWNVVGAIQAYEARREAQALAIQQYENTRQRVENGLLTPVALTSSRAEVALRDQEILVAEVDIISAQNALKQLIAPGADDPVWKTTILPAERLAVRDVTVTLDEAIHSAFDRRPELEQLRLRLNQSQIDTRYQRQETRPSVNLQASIGAIGRAGTVYQAGSLDPASAAYGGVPDPASPGYGGLGTSWNQVLGFNFMNWSAGVQVDLPIRNRTAQAQYADAVISQRRMEAQTKEAQVAVLVEVRNAYEAIATRRKSLEVARLASQLSQEQLVGETARFEAGFSTNFEVLRYQRDFADARIRELQALISYEMAVTALERAMDIIVEKNDIVVANESR